ncbi:MAG: hypothetical protein Q9217_002485 [Psora testacea]
MVARDRIPSSLKQRRRSDYGYHLEYRTRWSDNDIVYSFLFDSIINAYLIEHCGRNPPTSDQIGLVISSQCNFFSSVGFPKVLDLGLRVNKLGRSSVTYEVGVFERGGEDVKAVGGYTHVFVDRISNRSATNGMTEEVRRGLSRLLKNEKAKL